MIIFKKNWLYRYNDWCDGNLFTIDGVNDSRSVCPYFWKSLWNVVVVNIMYLLVAHFPAVFGANIVDNLSGESLTGLPMLYASLGVGYTIFLTFGGLVFLITYSYVNLKEKLSSGKKMKDPNLVVEYLKAKKNKICPMMKWED